MSQVLPVAVLRARVLPMLAVLAVAASFFFLLGRAPLFDVDEGAFSEATMEMFQRGDFFSTYLNGRPRYDKPILTYWLQTASVAVVGPTELAFRLPSAIAASLWALAVFLFTRRAYGVDRAALAVLIMVTSPVVYVIGRAATADALLNALIAASMFSAWRCLTGGGTRWLLAAHGMAGAGFLAKGPVAVLIPVAVTLAFCLLRRDLKTWARAVCDWRGLTLFGLVALPWYVYIVASEGRPFIEGFFLRHNVNRFIAPMESHAGSLVYYVPALLLNLWPFAALLVPLIRRFRLVWRDDLQLFLFLWFAFVFLFFSVSGTKLPHYLLYGMTGLFVLMAVHADALRSRVWALLPAALLFAALLLLPRLVVLALPYVPDAYARELLSNAGPYFGTLYIASAGAALLLVFVLVVEDRILTAHKLALIGIVTVVALSVLLLPVAAGLLQEPIKEAALICRARRIDPVMWRLNAPSFSVYRGQPTERRAPRVGDVVITRATQLAALPGTSHEVLYTKNGIVLVRIGP